MTTKTVHLGFEVGTGDPVSIPLRHMVVTGQTQEAGKTTTLEALIARAGVQAVAFITKRGEGSFANARIIPPYFREQADWAYVAAILEASRGEKMRFERAWIIRASKGARSLADVARKIKQLLEDPKTKGINADVYLTLDAYLDAIVPQIEKVRWAPTVELRAGVNAMDLTGINAAMQHLVIRSTLEWIHEHAERTVVVVPEAWKFIPEGRGTPVKLAAEAFIREGAGLGNYLWLDSQDIAGVEKIILKSVPVWILGVQRERNEVERTVKQIPVGKPKPTPEEISTLGLGQFIACYGTHMTRVYVQPQWMPDGDARAIACGGLAVRDVQPPRQRQKLEPDEDTVNESEARALREENEQLREGNERLGRQVADLTQRVEDLLAGRTVGKPGAKMPAGDRGEFGTADERASGRAGANPSPAPATLIAGESTVVDEAFYQGFKARLIAEAPALLRVLVEKPELRVEVTRPEISAKGDTLRGRVARLLAAGFFDEGRTAHGVQKELARRGADPGPANTYKEMDALATLGFVTIEEGRDDRGRGRKLYQAVPDMKVHVVEVGR